MRWRYLGLVILCLLLALGFGSWRDYQKAWVNPIIQSASVTLDIPKGASLNQIIVRLQAQQLEFSPLWFKVMAYQLKLAGKLQAGEYELKQGATVPNVLQQLAEGKVKQYSLTFPEGWCFKDMLALLNTAPNLQHTLTALEPNAILPALGLSDTTTAEGWFFPATYNYSKDMTDVAILKRAHQKQREVLAQEWELRQADLPLANPYQALILASIIEKETADVNERAQIAGVFVRRLQKGMLLQTDPTVIYGMGEAYHGNIRRKDLTTASPYNTYMLAGLPPTPIAMPGREAIHAALHPAVGKSLYFVAKGEGKHEFSDTLEAHTLAVKKYQLKHL